MVLVLMACTKKHVLVVAINRWLLLLVDDLNFDAIVLLMRARSFACSSITLMFNKFLSISYLLYILSEDLSMVRNWTFIEFIECVVKQFYNISSLFLAIELSFVFAIVKCVSFFIFFYLCSCFPIINNFNEMNW